jgi:hypothetical protein
MDETTELGLGDYVRCEYPLQDNRTVGLVTDILYTRNNEALFEVMYPTYDNDQWEGLEWYVDVINGKECEKYRRLFSQRDREETVKTGEQEIFIGHPMVCREGTTQAQIGIFKGYNKRTKEVTIEVNYYEEYVFPISECFTT